MRDLIARTRLLFAEGMPLAEKVSREIRVDIEMFSRGGLAVLDAIETIGYNTLEKRPSIGKGKQARLLGRALFGRLISIGSSREARIFVSRMVHATGRRGNHRRDQFDFLAAPPAKSPPPTTNVARVARKSASNFYYAFYLLPEPKRRALCALYAFMRLVDDVSTTSPPQQAREGDDRSKAARPGALARA